MRTGICKLCGKHSDLIEGHIIPKFVGSYLKETSITGRLRNSANPNIPYQDIDKAFFFCKKCEDIMSIDENYFSQDIFYPYHQGISREFNYKFRLGRFLIIQAYRKILFNNYLREFNNQFPPNIIKRINKAKVLFRDFILNEAKSQNEYSNHLLMIDFIEDGGYGLSEYPENINLYLGRALDSSIITSEKGKIIVYTKMCKIICLTSITPKINKSFNDIRVYADGNISYYGEPTLPIEFMHFMFDRCRLSNKIHDSLSVHQKDAISKIALANKDKIENSECTKAILADELLEKKKNVY